MSDPNPPNPPATQSQPHPKHRPQPTALAGDEIIVYEVEPGYRVLEMRPPGPHMICPFCGYSVTPIITHEPSLFAWMMCMAVSIIFLPFFFIGFLIGYFILVADSMQEARYVCPVCGNFLPVTPILI